MRIVEKITVDVLRTMSEKMSEPLVKGYEIVAEKVDG